MSRDDIELPRAAAYRHTMDNTEGCRANRPEVILSPCRQNPFGIAGINYSAAYPVTTERLYTEGQVRAIIDAALAGEGKP